MAKQVAYRAYSSSAGSVTEDTPRKAANAFFAAFPGKRKCNVGKGEIDGPFFTVVYDGKPIVRWTDVTKKTMDTLPDEKDVV